MQPERKWIKQVEPAQNTASDRIQKEIYPRKGLRTTFEQLLLCCERKKKMSENGPKTNIEQHIEIDLKERKRKRCPEKLS